MISSLELPEYYITSVNIDISPELGQTIQGQVSSQFEVTNPELIEEPDGLTCEAKLELDLYQEGDAPWQVSESETPEEFGRIEANTYIFIPGEHDNFKPNYQRWEDGSYYDVDSEFRQHLESGVLHRIITPIGDLVGNSFNGVVPRMGMTPSVLEDME
ncbi:hypothetical protein [Halosolutus halophilus]|uniref:hypothetical protein n=1 Tax=Halosolutus halophilus TaxID=1552990 RepID=UPI00223527CB|nr:hypothetical protein [Halosolutus halophilus]